MDAIHHGPVALGDFENKAGIPVEMVCDFHCENFLLTREFRRPTPLSGDWSRRGNVAARRPNRSVAFHEPSQMKVWPKFASDKGVQHAVKQSRPGLGALTNELALKIAPTV